MKAGFSYDNRQQIATGVTQRRAACTPSIGPNSHTASITSVPPEKALCVSDETGRVPRRFWKILRDFPGKTVEGTCDVQSSLDAVVARIPRFEPHSLLKSGHAQTVVASLMTGRRFSYRAKTEPIVLDDGDTIILHDDRPENWCPTAPTALLVHGLAGDYSSGYMTRVAGKLSEAGVRVFRMDLRACGAGEGQSRMPYHPGITQDLLHAMEFISKRCSASPLTLVGFSIGGNIALKMLADYAARLPWQLGRAIVVNPPIDIPLCMKNMAKTPGRFYDRHLVKHLYRQFCRSDLLTAHAPHVAEAGRPRGMREFDAMYSSAVWGFENVDRYYEQTSALTGLGNIRVPTLMIAARDDPVVPIESFESLSTSSSIHLHITDFRWPPRIHRSSRNRCRSSLDGLADPRLGTGRRTVRRRHRGVIDGQKST